MGISFCVMIKVSVIVTTFNSEKSIAKTLASVRNQDGKGTLFDLEIIVVDDCSIDRTADVLLECNITTYYITPSNSGGPNRGRNIGLRNTTGDYICFIDHDDTWEPQKLKLQLEAAKYAPIISCAYRVTNAVSGFMSVIGNGNVPYRMFQSNETFLKKLSKEKKSVQHTYLSTLMIHKDLKDVYFEEYFGMIDYDWTLRLFENKTSVEIPISLVSRFVNKDNLSLNYEYRKRDYYFSLMCLETYEKKYPHEVSLAHKRINGSRARYYYLMGEMSESRKFLMKAMPGFKEIFYYLTTFFGSRWVKKRFIIFG